MASNDLEVRTVRGQEWLLDVRGNWASIAKWGSHKAAAAALRSCTGCTDCRDCEDCAHCDASTNLSGCDFCDQSENCVGCVDTYTSKDCHWCAEIRDCVGCDTCGQSVGLEQARYFWRGGCVAVPPEAKIERLFARVAEAVRDPKRLAALVRHADAETHSWEGWLVHLAGPAGYALERQTSTEFAALLLSRAADPQCRLSPRALRLPCDEALREIRRLADRASS